MTANAIRGEADKVKKRREQEEDDEEKRKRRAAKDRATKRRAELSRLGDLERGALTRRAALNRQAEEAEAARIQQRLVEAKAALEEELAELMRSAAQDERKVGDVPGNIWWPALLLLLWATGERIGAAMDLTRDKLDTRNGWVTFPAETRKGGRADNTLPLADDTCERLSTLLAAHQDKQVFAWPYSKGYLYVRYKEILHRAGLPADRARKFHCIRKSTASHYEAAGGDATKLLGQSSRRITEAYLDPRIAKQQPAVSLLFRPG